MGKYGLQEHGAELVSELERLQPSNDSGELGYSSTSWLVQTVLDAPIKIRHPVDPSVLMPFRRRWGPEVLILFLARDAQANRGTWFSLFSEDLPCEQWLAVSNFLGLMRPPGFAENLLSEAQFRLHVLVTDKPGGMGGGSGGDGGACDKQRGIQGHLAKFADYTPEQTRNVFEPSLSVFWQNSEDYTWKVSEALSSQAQWIQWMVNKLTGSRLLTPEERSSLRLTIQIQPVDQRAGGDPLPTTEAFSVKFE